MFAHERQQHIIQLLKGGKRLSVLGLEKSLGASPATIRRDLCFLEEAGKVMRTHGGVQSRDQLDGEASFDRKSRHELRTKAAIADAAASLVQDGNSVFVDAGTTAFKVGTRLLARKDVTIFTNSIPLLNETPTGRARVVALGGEVRTISLALVGAETLGWVRRIRFDVAFIGASGIDSTRGPCTTELSEAAVKSAAIRNSRRAVVLAHASKWEQTAPIRFADWGEVDDVVTDYRPTASERSMFSHLNVRFHQA